MAVVALISAFVSYNFKLLYSSLMIIILASLSTNLTKA